MAVRVAQKSTAWLSTPRRTSVGTDAGIARLILVNGLPASGKSTVARRYVDDHDGAALAEVVSLRMTLATRESHEATKLTARDLAGAAVVEHLGAGCDVVMAQHFGRLGYIILLDVARLHGVTFVEAILVPGADLAIDRFCARRQALTERGEHHPERDIADADVDAFILSRRPPQPVTDGPSGITRDPLEPEATEDEIYRRLCSALGETAQI